MNPFTLISALWHFSITWLFILFRVTSISKHEAIMFLPVQLSRKMRLFGQRQNGFVLTLSLQFAKARAILPPINCYFQHLLIINEIDHALSAIFLIYCRWFLFGIANNLWRARFKMRRNFTSSRMFSRAIILQDKRFWIKLTKIELKVWKILRIFKTSGSFY